jgi:uncharacterized protein YbjT (DUF2867 family)
MTNESKKILAVVGSTGAQGGGLARAILSNPRSRFRVRALTRTPESDAARELAKLGAEVVAADVGDAQSLERAFAGADAAFCVTFFWAHMSGDRELDEAHGMARAAKSARVAHVIWSTLEDTRRFMPLSDKRMPTLQGKYKVPHFDAKGAANEYFAELGVPTTYLNTSFYWDNFVSFGLGPKRDADGNLAITLPMGDKRLPGIASEDIGHVAAALFEQGNAAIGKTIGIAGDNLTGAQMASAFSKALGAEVRYREVSPEAYRAFGFPAAEELGNMFQFKRDFEADYVAARNIEATRKLYPGLQSFDQWLRANAKRIPL